MSNFAQSKLIYVKIDFAQSIWTLGALGTTIDLCYESNNREPLPTGWDWAANSLKKAFPPPLIRGTSTGTPTPITTIGEARKTRRQQFSEARAREEVCPVHAARDTTQETSKGEVNTLANVTPSTTPNVQGTEKSAPSAPDQNVDYIAEREKWQLAGNILGPIFYSRRKKTIRFGRCGSGTA